MEGDEEEMIEHDFKTLRYSDRGYLVRHLQNLLNVHMPAVKMEVDGSFGPATENKVKDFQETKGLSVDGVVGPNTWQSILNIPKNEGTSYANYELQFVKDYIPKDTPYTRRPGKRFTMGGLDYNFSPEWVTIHNTGNLSSTAKNERAWLVNPVNHRVACWHRVVDQHYCVDAVPFKEPLGEVAFHAGAFEGNNKSIGIESVESGDLTKVYRATVKIAALTLLENDIPIWKLTTHNMWSGKNCPRILKLEWKKFVLDTYATLRDLKENSVPIVNDESQEPIETPEPTEEPTIDPIETPTEKQPDDANKEKEDTIEKPFETNRNFLLKIKEMIINLLENILK